MQPECAGVLGAGKPMSFAWPLLGVTVGAVLGSTSRKADVACEA
jgi:hypothetical protein